MSQHVVVGTAGHVDHGKTALVKALTDTDTDRWAEEKRRGITIDLGFARLDLGNGVRASIVDVPGHEDFVRNMVAGATGVDVALLVVAADEGIMPQTVEHVAILEFLGVSTGVIAITKTDLVDPEWLSLVAADVEQRLGESTITWERSVSCSAVNGGGVDDLRTALAAAAARTVAHAADDLFRMPVDRVFSVAGAGTVLTGSTWTGCVAVGEEVEVLPGSRGPVRIRSIEVHGEAREHAEPGRRTALALAGLDRGAAARGSVVVVGAGWRASRALDVMISLLPEARPLTQRSRVRLHLGTAEVMARVTPAAEAIVSGSEGAARLRLERPIVARWGDRGVIRSFSPITTIGGIIVFDPWPPTRPRRPVRVEERVSADVTERLSAFLELAGGEGISTEDLPVRVGVPPREIEAATGHVMAAGGRLFAPSVADAARTHIVQALAGYHEEHPLEPGMPRGELRQFGRSDALVERVLGELATNGEIVLEGGTVRLSDFQPSLSASQSEWADVIRDELGTAGFEGRTVRELERRVPDPSAQELVRYFVRQGTAVRVGKDRYYDCESLDRLREEVVAEIRLRGRASPAELRERTGLTRKYLIPVLEWLDAGGYTQRDGDYRRLGPAA